MYRVMSGHVRVEKGNDSTKVGQGAVLNSLGSGHTFGETCLSPRVSRVGPRSRDSAMRKLDAEA